MFKRKQILQGAGKESLFLWGARQTGKSTLLKEMFPNALWFDLLMTDVYQRLLVNPAILRETALANKDKMVVVIDEVQMIPALINEIHWLITNTELQFIMSGSSSRKIIRSGMNLLGGRAMRYELYPLISREIPDFDLLRALNHGLLPRHYLADKPDKMIAAYIGNYLKDEIASEGRFRNAGLFAQFLESAAFSNGETVNYSNIAADCGVSSPTVKEYFQILQETLIGYFVPAYQKRPKRRVISSPKFYLFDIGITNYLLKRGKILPNSEIFGKAFEHFIFLELKAHSSYSGISYPIAYWRTVSQMEIDFVLGDHEVAIEVKATQNVGEKHLMGLKRFMEEYKTKYAILVCNEPMPRLHDKIMILPWQVFLQQLWAGELMK